MYKPIPSKLKLPKRGEPGREDRQGRRLFRLNWQEEAGEGKPNASISKKMEEKYIYTVGRTSTRRSTSTNGNKEIRGKAIED